MITIEQLAAIMPKSTEHKRALFVEPLNAAMKEFEINTPKRQAAFLAQLAHESGQLRYMEEIASGRAYEHRKDLGNLEPDALKAAHAKGTTTGRFYKGHGPIQITGYYNHLKCGEKLGLDLVNYPMLLTQREHGCRAAGWFWKTHGLNELADKGQFGKISHIINGGYNGATERIAFYKAATNVLSA